MLKPATLGAVALVFLAPAAQSQEAPIGGPRAEVSFSNDTLEARYIDSGRLIDVAERSRVSAAFFLSEERDIVLNGDLMFPVQLGWDWLDVLIGPRAYAALLEDENDDVLALSVGADVRFVLDRNSRLAVAGSAFYSPDILTFGSADNLTDLSARLEIGVGPRVTVFGGMRWFEFDLTEGAGERTLMEEVFIGVGYTF